MAAPRRRAFTLLEILVAMSILSLLGLCLIVILRGGLHTWRRAEARREAFDSAEAVLGQLREDLEQAAAPFSTPLSGLGEVEVRFVCDRDPQTGWQRLFLVRTLKGESEHPVTGFAGSSILGDAVVDFRGDLAEARYDRLRATGGLCEVAWVLSPDGVLYRGMKAPIGPPRSLFADRDAYELESQGGGEAESDVDLPPLLRPFAREVLWFELRFWTQYSTTWSAGVPVRRQPGPGEQSGPLDYWDSTRGMLAAPEGADPRTFDTFLSRASLTDPRDDILPRKVLVKITFREPLAAGSTTFLTAPLGAREDRLQVQDPGLLPRDGGWVKLDEEWIHYRAVEGDEVLVADGGRGARDTVAAEHGVQTAVEAGRTFLVVVPVPTGREDWGDHPAGAMR